MAKCDVQLGDILDIVIWQIARFSSKGKDG